MEGSGESLFDEVLSRDPLDTLFLEKSNRGENLSERHMSPYVLMEEQIKVVCQWRECIGRVVKTYQKVLAI